MDYQKLYQSIVSRSSLDSYTESHHIIPKCMGGANDKTNLVRLSYREHFLCHWLLCKIYPENFKLKAAFCKMLEITKNNQRVVTSKQFDIVKRIVKDVNYPWLKEWISNNGGPWNKGVKGAQIAWNKGIPGPAMSEDVKKKISDTLKERYKTHDHPSKGRKAWCSGTKGMGIVKAWNKGIPAERWICPHCGKEGGGESNKNRWHFDNCKMKG